MSRTLHSEVDRKHLAELLLPFGCSERETEIYVAALQRGPSTVQELAKTLGLNRITLHSAVERLAEKGFLFESRKGKRRLVCAERPTVLQQLVQRRLTELKLLQAQAAEAAQMLEAVENSKRSGPRVKLYEGVTGLKRMLDETLTARGEVLVFSYVHLLAELISPKYLEDYFRRRAAKGIKSRLLFPPCAFATKVNKRAAEYRISVRLLPAEVKWRSGIFCWNDTLALLSYTRGSVACTIIENDDIAYFYRSVVFQLAWMQAKPIVI